MPPEQPQRPKTVLCARVSTSGYEYVQSLADEQDVTMSHMTRRLLQYAVERMPRDWKPRKETR
jgi:hypothetical protein